MTSSGCPPTIRPRPRSGISPWPLQSDPIAPLHGINEQGGALHLTVYDATMLWSSPYDTLRARKSVIDSTSDV